MTTVMMTVMMTVMGSRCPGCGVRVAGQVDRRHCRGELWGWPGRPRAAPTLPVAGRAWHRRRWFPRSSSGPRPPVAGRGAAGLIGRGPPVAAVAVDQLQQLSGVARDRVSADLLQLVRWWTVVMTAAAAAAAAKRVSCRGWGSKRYVSEGGEGCPLRLGDVREGMRPGQLGCKVLCEVLFE